MANSEQLQQENGGGRNPQHQRDNTSPAQNTEQESRTEKPLYTEDDVDQEYRPVAQSPSETKLLNQTTEKDQDTPDRIIENLTNPMEDQMILITEGLVNDDEEIERMSQTANQLYYAKDPTDPAKRESLGAWKNVIPNPPDAIAKQNSTDYDNNQAVGKKVSSLRVLAPSSTSNYLKPQSNQMLKAT